MHPSPSALNETALLRLQELGGNQLVSEMIDLFLTHAPRLIEAARAGCFARDSAAVLRAVHSLKNNASVLGVEDLRQLAYEFEMLLREEEHLEQLPERLAALQDSISSAARALLERRRSLHEASAAGRI